MAAMALYKNPNEATISALSSVILLANPAHQTVLNARKRLIMKGLFDADRELAFIARLIGGSKDCAKQSIIWDHRRWIFRRRYERIGTSGLGSATELQGWGTEASVAPMIPLDVLKKECELIRWACELYPRNYHAWTHYHWVLDLAGAFISKDLGPREDGQEECIRFLRREVVELREWISRHVSDYSAVHLLCSIAVIDAGRRQQAGCESGILADELREHALGLVLAYPSHEALWLYLRNVLSLCDSDTTRDVIDKLRSREGVPIDVIEKYIMK